MTSVIVLPAPNNYSGPMRQIVVSLLVLAAVLLMPFGMQPAAAVTHHDMTAATMPTEHCPEQAPSHDNKAGFVLCTMACSAALPVADLLQKGLLPIAGAPLARAAVQMLRGLHPDTATPPPKVS